MALSSDPARRGFLPPQNDKERLFDRRVQDLCRAAQSRGVCRCTGFLSDREQALAQAAMNRLGCGFGRFDGGYPGAERKVLCLEPAGVLGAPPIRCVQIDCPGGKPAHKDILGALLGLGLERECVGDILPDPGRAGRAWAFVLDRVAPLVCGELSGVGRLSASASLFDRPLPWAEPERRIKTATVASLRADAVLAAMLRCSRAQAEQLIRGGRLEINHVPVSSPHAPVYEEDVFTVHGTGRFKLTAVGGKSRKDRLFIEYFQY